MAMSSSSVGRHPEREEHGRRESSLLRKRSINPPTVSDYANDGRGLALVAISFA